MRRTARALLLFCSLFPAAGLAKTTTVLVGGGATPDSAQGSIELNVIWLTELLDARPGELKVFFNGGEDSATDVYRRKPPDEVTGRYEALARVLDKHRANRDEFYTNRVDSPSESTEADRLLSRLENLTNGMESGDDLFFIYNGHGLGGSNYRDNTLRVWNDTRVSVTQLEAVFSNMPEQSTLRYFMPQCYAGGFEQLAYKNADPHEGLSAQTRCGFMSVPRDRPSEGCTPSVNTDDYRDYTTYFFSALSGRTRDGGALPADPDFDGNGAISLLEAHYHSMVHAESTDRPRSTSEQYLLRWRPWPLRWIRGGRQPDNDYAELTRRLARQLELDTPWDKLGTVALGQIDALQALVDDTEKRLGELHSEQSALQKELQKELFFQWPQLKVPYTAGHARVLDKIDSVDRFIRAQDAYPELVSVQEKLHKAGMQRLTLQRDINRLRRLRRLRDLAYALKHFNGAANKAEKQAFERLRSCERWEPAL